MLNVAYDVGFLFCRVIMDKSPIRSILQLFHYVEKAILLDPGYLENHECTGGKDGYDEFFLNEGFAGAAPLKALEEALANTQNAAGAREMTQCAFKSCWQACGVDYFICTHDDEAFIKRVDELVAGLTTAVSQQGRTVKTHEPRWNTCPVTGGTIVTVDVRVSGIGPTLSFVQAPHQGGVEQVIEDFDIEVAKVMYNPVTKSILTCDTVIESVQSGKSTTMVSPGPRLRWEAHRIRSTLMQVDKLS